MEGKTKDKEDRFTAKFIDLIPNKKIAQFVNFESLNPDFSGEMIIEITLEPIGNGTNVTYFFKTYPKESDLKIMKREQYQHLKN